MRRFLRTLRGFFTGRIFLSLICLGIASIAAFWVLPRVYSDQEAVIYLPRVRLELAVGDRIGEKHLEYLEIGAYNLPVSIITTREDIIGRYARMPMLPGDFVFPEKISEYHIDPSLDYLLTEGLRLVTVTPKGSAAALAAHLLPGDVVSIATIIEKRAQETNTLQRIIEYPVELSDLTIYDVENARGISLGLEREEEEVLMSSGQSVSEDMVPRTITFLVDDLQADLLLNAEYNGGFHIIFKDRRP